jgi:hypothetical protein
MADADFGYVGGAPGKIDLYVGKEVVQRGIPMEGVSGALGVFEGEEGNCYCKLRGLKRHCSEGGGDCT